MICEKNAGGHLKKMREIKFIIMTEKKKFCLSQNLIIKINKKKKKKGK